MPGELALPSLEIHNFRGLRELKISRLGRVNLIVGKNGVGKTSVLEALNIYGSKPAYSGFLEVLNSRSSTGKQPSSNQSRGRPLPIEALFFDRDLKLQAPFNDIRIGPIMEPTRVLHIVPCMGPNEVEQRTTSLEVIQGTLEKLKSASPEIDVNHFIPVRMDTLRPDSFGLMFTFANSGRLIPTEDEAEFLRVERHFRTSERVAFGSGLGVSWVHSNGFHSDSMYSHWSRAALEGRENEIIQAVQILDPTIGSLFFAASDEVQDFPTPFVRRSIGRPELLSSLGDGINRMFGLALAMIGSSGRIALIDEVENGLHYSIQSEMWRFIFRLATQIGIQVFATTHSSDCIKAFQTAASESEEEGVLIRLARSTKRDRVLVAEFDEESLEVAVDGNIEVR